MHRSLILAALALLAAWVAIAFSVAGAEFTTNEGRPAWQAIVKTVRIIVLDGGRLLRQDDNRSKPTVAAPRGRDSDEFVDVTPPERAGAFMFVATVAAGPVLKLVGAATGMLPRVLTASILGAVVLLALLVYLNRRPLVPLHMKMPDAVYVIMLTSVAALAFASGLLFVLGARAARRSTPA